MEETFKNWFAENKEGSLKDDYDEYKAEMEDEECMEKPLTFRQFAKERYDEIYGM